MNRGITYAAIAYVLWGLFPIYIKSLRPTPPEEIVACRMVGSLLFVLLVLAFTRHWGWIRQIAVQPRLIYRFVASALAITVNWGVFIWAINSGHVVESSLGYFINPLVNVFLGWAVLREQLRWGQWGAVALAAAGVGWLTWQSGALPWTGLALAFSFSTYGLLRKTASLGAVEGLALETTLLFPFAMSYLVWLAVHEQNSFINGTHTMRWLLGVTGPATAIPLMLFAAGARRIPFSQLGLLQYIGPTLQLLIGVWIYHEAFPFIRAIGYATIWLALVLYLIEGAWFSRAALS